MTNIAPATTARPAAPFRQMIFTENVRKYSTEQGIAEEEALKHGLEARPKELVEQGAEVYAKA